MKKALLLAALLLSIIFVQAETSLFDLELIIPSDYKVVSPGEEVLATVKLVNAGTVGREDVFLDYWITDSMQYWITDSEQNIISTKTETVAVETQLSLIRHFYIPDDAEPGGYYLYARITYADGKGAVAKHFFQVIEKPAVREPLNLAAYYIFAYVLVGLAILILLIAKSRVLIKRMQIRAKVRRIVEMKLSKVYKQ